MRRGFDRRVAVVLVGIAGALIALPASAGAVTFRGPERVSSAFSRGPAIAAGATSTTVVWTQIDHSKRVMFRDLKLGGWTLPQSIPGSSNAEDPVIAEAPNGATVVAWQNDDRFGVSYRPPGGVFGPAKLIGDTSGSAGNADFALAVNASGRTVVVWTHTDSVSRSVQAAFGSRGSWGAPATIDGGTTTSSASGASVAIDGAGRAIAIYGWYNPDVSGSDSLHQVLSPAGGAFGDPTTIDPKSEGENSVDNNPRVASNSNGDVIAGWGFVCECVEVFYAKAGIGSTTTGITTTDPVGIPGHGSDGRKSGAMTPVAIDEQGRGTMLWDGSKSGLPYGYDYWAVHTAGGAIGPSTMLGTNSEAIAGDLRVAAAGGKVIASWQGAESPGQPGIVRYTQDVFPGAVPGSWTPLTAANTGSLDADSQELVMQGNGIATIAFRAGDRTYVDTSAPRDTRTPSATLPRSGSRLPVRHGAFLANVGCPASEAECILTGKVTARDHGHAAVVATATDIVTGGSAQKVTFRLTRRGKSLANMAGPLAVSASVTIADDSGNKVTLPRAWNLV